MQRQADLRCADCHKFVLVGLDIAQFPDDVLEKVVPFRAEEVNIRCNELVYREDVGHFDIQCGLGLGIKVVEFINVKIRFCILYRYH